ncbi:uncharacterized protein LOC6555639 [Drosophila erecta]|uniref:Uncharacterized protein n=1 Tax=Drosophila erecta TaxID=7220 RepID=B3P9J5_DROER|nr:uncharacterized protein LOC6555639 [Drosophila erecta]EDV45491.1 uncharacterized protein Dere_GG12691 [Drosophila erecta]
MTDLLPRLFVLLLVCASVSTSPMLYKLNPEEKYEADLVPVSSTVIPLTVLEVSYGAGGKPSEEYKAAYLRKLRKQVLQRTEKGQDVGVGVGEDDEDVLITVKSQKLEKAKVKAVRATQAD